ncbi:MAG: helix-turn-helix transcriptional regulator [Armatimonadetes bacterium]|nr:helix-turn-helix transcriptional regulator [Armatimonadota bacterium]
MASEFPGSRLRRLRLSAGMTLEELAGKIKVPFATLQFWETTPGRLKEGTPAHRKAVAMVCELLGSDPALIWQDRNIVREGQAGYEQDVRAEIAAFLTRIAWNESVPEALREEALELRDKVEEKQSSE